jgi:hypothetical protein
LYLLVPDIDLAADVLLCNDWKDAPQPAESTFHFLSWHPEIARRRFSPPESHEVERPPSWPPTPPGEAQPRPKTTVTVLLSTADWNFSAEKLASASLKGFLPPLPALTDSLIEKLLDSPHESRLQRDMAVQVCYLYGYVPELMERSYAKELKYENRQFHYDAISGLQISTLGVISHERLVRDELRKGQRQLQECSASRD